MCCVDRSPRHTADERGGEGKVKYRTENTGFYYLFPQKWALSIKKHWGKTEESRKTGCTGSRVGGRLVLFRLLNHVGVITQS